MEARGIIIGYRTPFARVAMVRNLSAPSWAALTSWALSYTVMAGPMERWANVEAV